VTLFRQLLLAVMVLMALLYGANSAISLSSARALIDGQMAVHAADAATALAVAISQNQAVDDVPLLEALFNALSDSGYYQRVELVDPQGRTLIRREFPAAGSEVPDWFLGWLALPERIGRADVVSGWTRAGEVVVVSHPGQAYRQLWQLAGRQLGWFALATVVFSLCGALALRRLLVPLERVAAQADAIREQRFEVQERLPRAPELRSLVEAMNRMAARLGQLFAGQAGLIADLRQAAAVDAVTGLANRADFDARLQALIEDSDGRRGGMLGILALDDLAQVNTRWGRIEGNALLRAIGAELGDLLAAWPGALLARRQGAEFAVFVPDLSDAEADALAADLLRRAESTPFAHREQWPLRLRLGYSRGELGGSAADLLEEAGAALAQLTPASAPAVARYSPGDSDGIPLVSRSAIDWPELIEQLLEQRALTILCQPAVSVPERAVIGCELYTRAAPEVLGAALAPAALLPMVERAGRAAAYDQVVLELLAAQPPGDYPWYALNLSAQTLRSAEFLGWLEEFLGTHRALANRLVFELPESAATAMPDRLREFQRLVARHGSGLGLDHFGLEASNFAYLGSLPLAHVKVHRSITAELHLSRDNQFYVKSLAQLVHTREIPLIVEGVEREEQWRVLPGLNVDAAQGFLLGSPVAASTPGL
jgi:EAL domain-containing protein (putative c-di-GMP-specific phosphodiesterase class I)/GGDEF domain-containing protein